ncbi:MAG: helix-turn-helix domain-containing protein [Treponemataceae bacterium]|nr:helix-turn-helix domain-containing protein [Treponemataceae bacterium]
MEKKDDDITSLELKVASSIQSERLARKMSQLELALEAGISQGYLAMVESHQKIPTITTVFKIAKALNINPASLLSDADIDRHEIKEQVIELIRQKL